jgi:sulfur transfer complex TusBCD TusB component (DsrH family)
LINRFLDLEDGGTYASKQDAIAKLLEDRLTNLKLVDDKEFVKWCEDYEG